MLRGGFATSPLLHLPTGTEIKQRLLFYNTGSQQEPTVIAGHIDGRGPLVGWVRTAARRARQPCRARPEPAPPEPWADCYDRATGAFTVPPRTAVVFVTGRDDDRDGR